MVADLGVAKAILHASGLTHVVGTPAYMAPEQAVGLGVDERADVYALAAVTYQMLTGRLAHAGTIADLATLQPPPPPSELADLPPEIDEIVLRGLAPDPEDRWPTVRAFVNALQPLAPERRADPVGEPARLRAADARSAAGRGGSTALLVLVCLAVFLACFGGSPRGHPAAALTRRSIPGRARSEHYRARWVTPPLVARSLRHPPAWRDRKRHEHVRGPFRPPVGSPSTVATASTSSSSAPSTSRSSSATTTRPGSGPSSRSTRPPSDPALGGTRFYPYATTADAIRDVLNLSRGMSYKAALAGLDLGGGKAVIIGDPTKDKTEALLRAYGRFVQSLGGRYYTACDVGHLLRGHGRRGARVRLRHRPDRRPRWRRRLVGAHGVRRLPGHARQRRGARGARRRLSGRTVGIAGVGKVGHHLVKHLVEDGAQVVVTDVYQPAVERVRAASTAPPRSPTPTRWCARRSTSTRRARWATRSPTRWSTC